MYSKQLAKTMRYFKETDEGVNAVSRVTEEIRNETELETREDVALSMIVAKVCSIEEIAKITKLSLERVQELAGVKGA